jgi:hypothetical protein
MKCTPVTHNRWITDSSTEFNGARKVNMITFTVDQNKKLAILIAY